MDSQTIGLVLIAISVGSFFLRVAVRGRPALALVSRISTLTIVGVLVGLVALVSTSFLGGPGD